VKSFYEYRFAESVPMENVRASLVIARVAAEGEHGAARVRLEGRWEYDLVNRCYRIDASSPVGESIARILTSLLLREFGEDAFWVERVTTPEEGEPGSSVDRPANFN
jgi:hypothetical protein